MPRSNNNGSGGEERQQPQKRLKITGVSNSHNKNSYFIRLVNPGRNTSKSIFGKGKLGILPSLSLDILFEIFSHLLPFDVLRLARATKDLRRLLMHKSAICIWRAALSNVPGMPECPPDMSLPAFVNLAFDPHCHNCLAPNIRHIDWHLRIRLCVRCFGEVLFPADEFIYGSGKGMPILSCIPFGDWYWSRCTVECCTIKAKREFINQLDAIDGDQSAFINQCKADMKVRREHAMQCKTWSDLLTSRRTSELERIRHGRSNAISQRLQAIGYGDELQYLGTLKNDRYKSELVAFNDHPLVKQPRPLTDRIWNNIEWEMVLYMEAARADRVNHEHQNRQRLVVDFWNEYRRRKPTNDLMPGPIELWELEEIEHVVNLPMEATVDLLRFARIIPKLPEFIHNWRHERMLKLIDNNAMKIPGSADYSAQMKQLQLAACVFVCNKTRLHAGHHNLWYPHFIHHSCNTVCSISSPPQDSETAGHPALRVNLKGRRYRRKKWSMDSLSFDDKASHVVRKILEACGLDYRTVSVKKLDKRDPRLVCLECSHGNRFDGEQTFTVRTWRDAVKHCMKRHHHSSQVEWQKISDEDAAEARILEWKKNRVRGDNSRPWCCAHCRYKPNDTGTMKMEKLRRHLSSAHNVHVLVQGGDYYAALESPPYQSRAVKMVPKTL